MEVDPDDGRVLLEYANSELEWVEPNVVQEALLSRGDQGAAFFTFSKILNHRTGPQGRIEVEVLWDTNEATWEPLTTIRKDDPLTVAKYAKDRCLLEQRGWTWAKRLVTREKKFIRMLKLFKASQKSNVKYKFGIEVARSVKRALELDRINGNTHWQDVMALEVSTMHGMDTFKDMGSSFDWKGYQYIPIIWCFDVKFDFRRRARAVANGSMSTPLPADEVYSGVVSIDTVRIAMTVAKLNGLKICAADITSAYLEAYTSELKYTVLSPEFGPDWGGKRVKIDKALYSLIGSCSSFHSHLCAELYELGFRPSKADSDLWLREQDDYYE